MLRHTVFAALLGLALASSVHAQSPESELMATLAQDLKLTPAQQQQMDKILQRYGKDQEEAPLLSELAVQHQAEIHDVIRNDPYDDAKASQLVEKLMEGTRETMLNRLKARHEMYQVLTPQQQRQFLEIIDAAVGATLQ